MESAEAEGTLQDLVPWTSVRSDAFVVGKQDMSVTIALHARKVEKEREVRKANLGLVRSDHVGQERFQRCKRLQR